MSTCRVDVLCLVFPLTVITQVCTVADAGAPDKEPVFASNFMPARGFADRE